MTSIQQEKKEINVLELRNYLLKPNTMEAFDKYFNAHFVEPMNKLGGYTLGQFYISGINNRFVWLRGFADMKTRVKFLNDFYINSTVWKEFGKGANDMMINSDNVYLLRPLAKNFNGVMLGNNEGVTVVDFYICNSTFDKVIELFSNTYISFLETCGINNVSLWTSELQENDFPILPAFQDKNLLVAITNYKDEAEYHVKQNKKNNIDDGLKMAMQELITIQSCMVLYGKNYSTNNTAGLKIPSLKFNDNNELIIEPSSTSSKHDFDFFKGKWALHNKKLKTKLNNCTEWTEFESTQEMYSVLNGIGNIDNFLATFDAEPFEGMTVRLFNPKTKLWSIYWADSNEGKLDPPVVGSFENNVGHFFTKDIFNGKKIIVVFRWDARDKCNPGWSQAFSNDNGKTWEWNWYMYMSKLR